MAGSDPKMPRKKEETKDDVDCVERNMWHRNDVGRAAIGWDAMLFHASKPVCVPQKREKESNDCNHVVGK